MTILIIEDEMKAANELESLIHEIRPNDIICAKLQSIQESVEWLQNNSAPDLIFSDIQLSDGSCFEIFRQIKTSPVIFCTAYNQFALEAFDNNGIDYLLKPIEKEKLRHSFQKLEQLQTLIHSNYPEYMQRFERLMSHSAAKYKTSLLSYFRDQITPVPVSDIDFIYTENKVVHAFSQNKKYEIRETLDNLCAQLDPDNFFRANRQYIIHRQSISNIEHLFGRKLVIRLYASATHNIIISKGKVSEFLNWLEGA